MTRELAMRFELMEKEGRHIWGAWKASLARTLQCRTLSNQEANKSM